jgi:GNAT superfamily N-acetyltransferase
MPLSLPSIPVPDDELYLIPHRLGWDIDYWDGIVTLTPSDVAIVDLMLPLSGSRVSPVDSDQHASHTWRNVTLADMEQLKLLQQATFDLGVEYAGWTDDEYQRAIHDGISAFFGLNDRRPPGVLQHSFVAQHEGEIIAALLVRDTQDGFRIQPIMVAAAWQRQGLARHLLQLASVSLKLAGVKALGSYCHLGNPASLQWHRASGFEEKLNFFVAGHLAIHHEWMSRHYEAIGQTKDAETAKQLSELYYQLGRSTFCPKNCLRAMGVVLV